MRTFGGLLVFFTLTFLAVADEPPPRPGPWVPPAPMRADPDDDLPFLKTRLNDLFQQLDTERKALGAAYDTAAREHEQGLALSNAGSGLLRLRVKQLLAKLHQSQVGATDPSLPATKEHETPAKSAAAPKEKQPEKFPLLPPKEPSDMVAARPVDPLALAHALFRGGNYERALQAFEMMDLKGTRADQRAPVEYLMASCLHRLGKTKEATALYLQVANTKGDEQVAACAQYQIAALRWHKEVQDRLTEIKQRRLAIEKQP